MGAVVFVRLSERWGIISTDMVFSFTGFFYVKGWL